MLNATNQVAFFLPSRETLVAERAHINARMDYMLMEYSGCDWCCGGGDREMRHLGERLAALKEILGCEVCGGSGTMVGLAPASGAYIEQEVEGDCPFC